MKNLKKISALVAVVVAFAAAFAFKAPQTHTYAIGTETATQYQLIQNLDSQIEGTDYTCVTQASAECKAQTATLYTSFPVNVNKTSVTIPGTAVNKRFVD